MSASVDIVGIASVADQNANGFDPSTGRTPVEQTNNSYYQSGTITGVAIKAAPGFLHTVNASFTYTGVTDADDVALATVTIWDNPSAASGTKLYEKQLYASPVSANGRASVNISDTLDVLATSGLWLIVTSTVGGTTSPVLVAANTMVSYR